MTDALAHRGPDGEGFWTNANNTVGFGHRRLAIIDTSAAGRQPMHYLNRYTIVFNGELYNYPEIKATLVAKGYVFYTHTDTEVILAAYACYKQACLPHFDGMFAFAIWDDQEQTLFAARDRFGEKPFFYHFDPGRQRFLFASEIKALWQAGIESGVNKNMLYNFFTLGYVQNPHNATETFYTHIHKLPAGAYLTGNLQQGIRTHTYWKLNMQGVSACPEHEAVEKFRELLLTSVARRLRSDVPLGTSLSGGLDSSSIVAAITQLHPNGNRPLQTFSAVFPGYEKDESAYIQMVIEKFAVENHQVEPTGEGMVSAFEALCYHQDEPFSSSSLYAQFSVFALAKQQQVTVLLDGQGADETLAGYHQYYAWYWQELYSTGNPVLRAEIKAARSNGISEPWGWRNKLAASFPAMSAALLQTRRRMAQRRYAGLSMDFIRAHGKSYYAIPRQDKLKEVLHYNTCINGLEALLRYADRNSMAHGREVRLPFLQHELVEFVFSLPSSFKIRYGSSKWLLREAMKHTLPPAVVGRTDKTGFEPPQKKWMHNPALQEYIHEAKRTLAKAGLLQPSVLQKKIQPQEAHAAENNDWRYLVAARMIR